MSLRRASLAALLAAAVVVTTGCASAVKTDAVQFTPTTEQPAPVLQLTRETPFALATGYKRNLRPDSRWRLVGTVPQGQVFRPVDSVLTIEGRQVHEAYLVVSGGQLVGFYLPGEANYAALSVPVLLPLRNNP